MASRRLAAATAAAAALGLAGIAAPPAQAAGGVLPCAKHKHEVKRVAGSVLWTRGGSLFGCMAGYVDGSSSDEVESEGFEPSYSPTPARRLGQWSPASRVAFDGRHVVWAYRKRLAAGATIDRIYAVDLRAGKPWLRAARPTFDLADRRVVDLKVGKSFAAWVTEKGTVMAAAEQGFAEAATDGVKADLELVGAGTPGAPGLVATLAPLDRRLLIGRFAGLLDPQAATLELERIPGARAARDKECETSNRWEVTVQPVADAPRVGAIWEAAEYPRHEFCA